MSNIGNLSDYTSDNYFVKVFIKSFMHLSMLDH